jgi:hypothetical protein
MLGQVTDPGTATWHKSLVWLPFNAIATAVYLAIMARLAGAGGGAAGSASASLGRVFYAVVCIALITANWAIMFAA